MSNSSSSACKQHQPSRVRRWLLSSQKLTEPGKTIFDRVFVNGEKEAVVAQELKLSQGQFEQERQQMLRSLMAATQ